MELPVLHCARGTTLLESFHLYLASYVILVLFYGALLNCYNPTSSFRFILGSSASNLHNQGYLLEGLSRWNQVLALAETQQQDTQLQTFNLQLANKVDVFNF